MRIVISGSHGLIGSALLARLQASGHQVGRLVRTSSGAGTGAGDVRWDIQAGTVDVEALGGVDAVVSLAGEGVAAKRWTPDQKERIRGSRIDGTSLLARTLASLEPRPSVFVSASAIGYYGDRGDDVLDESSSPGEDFLARVCVDWEQAAAPAGAAGIRTVHVRTGIVLSAHGGALGKQLPLFKSGLGAKLGSGRQWTSWIHIDDEIGAIFHALEDPNVRGPVNLTAPEPVTNAAFTKALGRAVRRPAVLTVPPAALRVVFGRQLVDEALMASQRVLPKGLESTGYRFAFPELDAALASVLQGQH